MCKCDPKIRTPYCGKGDCVPPTPDMGEPYIKPDGQVTEFKVPEKLRTYYFAKEGYIYPVSFADVTKLTVRPSGTHRIETINGKHFIVPAGWLYVELDIEGWTK